MLLRDPRDPILPVDSVWSFEIDLSCFSACFVCESHKAIFCFSQQVPSIQTDDSALQNIELQDRLQTLEAENKDLKSQIRTLETRIAELGKNATASLVKTQDQSMVELIEQMKQLEEECSSLKSKVDLRAWNFHHQLGMSNCFTKKQYSIWE